MQKYHDYIFQWWVNREGLKSESDTLIARDARERAMRLASEHKADVRVFRQMGRVEVSYDWKDSA